MYSSTFGKRAVCTFWYECPLVVLACESLHVCTVCIWRCEHARFCVEVFHALYINFHSFINRDRGCMSKSGYVCEEWVRVCVFHGFELVR